MSRFVSVIATCLLCTSTYALEIGQTVIVVRRAELKVDQQVVDLVPLGAELVVRSVNDRWVWVSNGKPGWLSADLVMSPTDAVAHFTALLRAQPQNAEHLFARGNVYRSLGNFEQAVADFNEAIRLHPQAAGYNGRGRIWYEAGELDKAIADFTMAIQLNPTSAMLHNNRAAAWEKKGDLQQSLKDLERAHQLDAQHAFVQQNRARLQNQLMANRHPATP